jgi:NAD(P)H-hydrate epimerase
MRDVDDVVISSLGITLIQMMENAGRSLADLVIAQWHPRTVTVLVGSGHNGGGGLVAARHLVNRGVDVALVVAHPDALATTTAYQLGVARSLGIACHDSPPESSVVIDALIGYSLRGAPRGRVADLIDWATTQTSPVISLDVPSGLDATTGVFGEHCVHARATLSLALIKSGVRRAPSVSGELYLADISIPRRAYEAIGLEVPTLFSAGQILRLVRDVGEDVSECDGEGTPFRGERRR